ncbi:MAG: Hpt domain-containing protein [Nannocystaceae bacterium]|nr:Hpt domain-containing protein [Nannocystaceae bacterium]
MPVRDTIKRWLVLPSHISEREREYLNRLNRVGLAFFALHVPVFVCIAWLNGTGPLSAFFLTVGVLLGPAMAYARFENPRAVARIYGMAAMLMGGLLVHVGQGPVQIEMHFYFFALLAMLAVYGNPSVILTAAATVTAHHLVLWWLLPSSVFNYDAPLWVVLVHAAFVVLESIATVYVARSFFDNVIGLEIIVRERTAQLDQRNGQMRRVLDHVQEGLLTIDADGVVSPEVSRSVARLFGPLTSGTSFADLLERADPRAAFAFSNGYEQAVSGVLPIDVAIDQLPTEVKVDDRVLSLDYVPLASSDQEPVLEGMLIVTTDVTDERERMRLEREQTEVVRVFDHIAQDRAGFVEFFREASQLVKGITSDATGCVGTLKRDLHTLKGNAMLFDLASVFEWCHAMEDRLANEGVRPTADERNELAAVWTRLSDEVTVILGDRTDNLEVEPSAFEALLSAALRPAPSHVVAGMIADLKLEPTRVRLQRIAEQARGIARRLGKGEIEVRINDGDVRLDPRRWRAFWSSFVHVIRNSVDHGLESSEERVEAGKDGPGCVTIGTHLDGDRFIVRVEDDGRGVNWQRVRERAQTLGLDVSTQALVQEALFSDGVSTAGMLSEFSGRGIGMGALRDACQRLDGTIEIRSRVPHGTTVDFIFPSQIATVQPHELLEAA